MSDVTVVLRAIEQPNGTVNQLLPLVYDELRKLAAARMSLETAGHTLQPTALVHEAWLRLAGEGNRTWRDREHFFRAAALVMRRILVDRARQKSSRKRWGDCERVDTDVSMIDMAAASPDDRILLIDEQLEHLEQEDPESAQIIMLKFFAGLTNGEIARMLSVTERTVERQWAYAKATLLQMIRQEQ